MARHTGGAESDFANLFNNLTGQRAAGGPGAVANPDDPDILIGRSKSTTSLYSFGAGRLTWPQTQSYSSLLKQFYTLDSAEVRALQDKLWKAGFYGDAPRSSVVTGIHDEDTLNAYKVALGRAANFRTAGVNITLDEMLAQGGARGGPKGTKKAPFQPQLSNPDDLKAIFRVASTAELGHRVSDQEIDELVSTYRQRQLEAQRTNYDIEVAEREGPIATVASPEVFAENELWRRYPGEAGARELRGQMDEFKSLLGGVI